MTISTHGNKRLIHTNDIDRNNIGIMRHRIKAGKVGSFTPEKQKVEIEQLENREVADEVEEIFEEDSEFSNDAQTKWDKRNDSVQTLRTTMPLGHADIDSRRRC